MLAITRDQFIEVYDGTKAMDYINLYFTEPKNDLDYAQVFLRNKLWRLNNIYSIVNKDGDRVKFVMNLAQHRVFAQLLKHPRIIILKSRQQGISTLFLVSFFDSCITKPNFTSALMAQGQQEAKNLLKRTKLLWDCLHPAIKNHLGIDKLRDSAGEFSFTNGSSMQVALSFRSGTLQGCHISELGATANRYPQRAREVFTGTLQAVGVGNWMGIESTAEGENIFKTKWDDAVLFQRKGGVLTQKDFVPLFLSWTQDPDCYMEQEQEIDAETAKYFADLELKLGVKLSREQKNFWVAQKRELGRDLFQEYPATPEEAFLKNREGTYYADLYMELIRGQDREMVDLYDPNLPVHVAVDLGMNDLFVMVFFQSWEDGWRIIDCHHDSGHGIEHYCDVITAMAEEAGWNMGYIVLPHDAAVRGLVSFKTREEAFNEFGYPNTIIVPRATSLNEDIEFVRQNMKRMFVDVRAEYITDCFLNYTKTWLYGENELAVYKDKPEHNHYSHGADAIRQMVRSGLEFGEIVELPHTNREIEI